MFLLLEKQAAHKVSTPHPLIKILAFFSSFTLNCYFLLFLPTSLYFLNFPLFGLYLLFTPTSPSPFPLPTEMDTYLQGLLLFHTYTNEKS